MKNEEKNYNAEGKFFTQLQCGQASDVNAQDALMALVRPVVNKSAIFSINPNQMFAKIKRKLIGNG